MRYQFIEKQKKAWTVTLMCEVLGVSRRGYYEWTTRGPRQSLGSNTALDTRIGAIFA